MSTYGSLTLLEHTQQVTEAITLFAKKYAFDFDVEIARKGAIMHDLGKAHPHFQRKIQKVNGKTLLKTENGTLSTATKYLHWLFCLASLNKNGIR
ncbi:MAG: HD domain-containing protein [Spirosomataceae bacterium]